MTSDINHISNPCIYERKSRFMKWVSKVFKGSSGIRRVGESSSDENMLWHAPIRPLDDRSRAQKEKADLDRAIQLSLTEDLRRPSGDRWRRDHDEEHARALHGAWDSPFHLPPYHNPHPSQLQPRHNPHPSHLQPRHIPHPSQLLPRHNPHPSHLAPNPHPLVPQPQQNYSSGYKICGGCKREIIEGNYLGCMGTHFHPQCFRCKSCAQPITENEFSLSGKDPYHKACFKELAHPKCDVCHQFIPTNRAGLIEYRCHPFWLQKYCPSHEHDHTARCCSCERLESWDAKYVSLGDGRSLCFECMESAIMDTGDCQPLYHSIRDYYEGLYMRIDQQIPMLLVERQALNEAIVGEKSGLHHMPETRGLCLSEEQTVTSIMKRPRIGGHQLIGMRTKPQKLTRKCEVTAILVLYGLPRLLTGAILAHELMHGWLRLKGFRNLSPEVEEGICQVLSQMWLESEVMPSSSSRNMPSTSSAPSSSSSKKGGKSNVENKLGEFFMHQIAHDASPAYGGGFREAILAVNKYGLRRTLDHIRLVGSFPL